jgi:hypothetical protein
LIFSLPNNVVRSLVFSQSYAMFSSLHSILFLLAIPALVLACEGECIVGITKAFLRYYSTPAYHIFNTIASILCAHLSLVLMILHIKALQIEQSIIPPSNRAESSFDYIGALLSGYEQQCYAKMEHAIFPSYFHGKCQDENGVNPPGCPNPDCPVVCGTPGSLVHFYVKLRRIAFSETRKLLASLFEQDSETYKAVEKQVLKYANKPIPRMIRRRRDLAFASAHDLVDYEASLLEKRAQDIKAKLRVIMHSAPSMLEMLCGGVSGSTEDGIEDELPNCSWKSDITSYILTFP